MRKPAAPPEISRLMSDAIEDNRLATIFWSLNASGGGAYLHWHKLRFHQPPGDLSPKEWWLGLKMSRRNQYKTVPLVDKSGQPFQYLLADPIPARLHQIDLAPAV